MEIKEKLLLGHTSLGIEFGSTRIKAILIDDQQKLLADSSYQWENQLVDGFWTYSQDAIIEGLQTCFTHLKAAVKDQYGVTLTKIGQIGISAMMHGYLPFDAEGNLLVPFRTWRNNNTTEAAKLLTDEFHFNIPERWSIAHLYQSVLDSEPHLYELDFMTTLAGYIHWLLSDRKVLGVGDASGMFPIDSTTQQYDKEKLMQFDKLIESKVFPWQIEMVLPEVLIAGQDAGQLTQAGALLLDPEGDLEPGSRLCPPEGDAGTGMVATNSVSPKTGNVSAGTSIFAMIVLAQPLSNIYPEIDMVTTPSGDDVAMVHANNCTSDINAWVNLFYEFAQKAGSTLSLDQTYTLLFNHALEGDPNCGQLLNYGLFSGENIIQIEEGRPLLVRQPNSQFNLANLFKSQILSAFSTLAIGMELLTQNEQIEIDQLLGHGGIFTTPKVAQTILANILNIPVTVTTTSNEGGAWGMALLADYLNYADLDLNEYLETIVFNEIENVTVQPEGEEVKNAKAYLSTYKLGLPIEKAAISYFKS